MTNVLSMMLMGVFYFYFLFQPQMDQINSDRGLLIENVVHSALQQAALKGYFSSTDLQTIQNAVGTDLGYPTSDVQVTGTTTPQTRGNFIELSISVPTSIDLINLNGSNNKTLITRTEYAASDALQ